MLRGAFRFCWLRRLSFPGRRRRLDVLRGGGFLRATERSERKEQRNRRSCRRNVLPRICYSNRHDRSKKWQLNSMYRLLHCNRWLAFLCLVVASLGGGCRPAANDEVVVYTALDAEFSRPIFAG